MHRKKPIKGINIKISIEHVSKLNRAKYQQRIDKLSIMYQTTNHLLNNVHTKNVSNINQKTIEWKRVSYSLN